MKTKRIISFIIAFVMVLGIVLPVGLFGSSVVADAAVSPDYFNLKIDGENVTNACGATNAMKTIGTGAIIETDDEGNQYLRNVKGSGNFYKFNITNYFMLFYGNHKQSKSNDLSFTYELTINMEDLPASTQTSWSTVAGNIDSGGFGFGVSGNAGGEGVLVISTGGYFDSGSATYITFPFAMKTNNWYHLALAYDHSAKTATAYVNGVSIGTKDVPDLFLSYNWTFNGNNGCTIGGGSIGSTTVPFGNKVYSNKFFLSALTAEEVADEYTTEKATGLFSARPDYISMKVTSAGAVSNTVSGGPAMETRGTGTYLFGQDKLSKNYYISVDPSVSNGYYGVANMNTWYLKYYNDSQNKASTKTSFTWEVLVNLPSMPSANANYVDIMGYNASGGFSFCANNEYGAMSVCVPSGASTKYVSFPFKMQTNKWYHVIVSYDAANHILTSYVNGVQIESNEGSLNQSVEGLAYTYLWAKGMHIGARNLEQSAAKVAVNVGIFNFSMSSIDAGDAAYYYSKAESAWKLDVVEAPTPNYFSLAIDDTVSNTASSTAVITKGTGAEIKTDEFTGHKYIQNVAGSENFYKTNFDNWYLKFHYNNESGATNDLSFTYEIMINVDELPASTQTAYSYLSGYSNDGGFGIQVSGNKGAEGAFMIVTGDYWRTSGGTRTTLTIPFEMKAGTWYHLVLSYDHGNKVATGYVNGVKVGEVSVPKFSLSYSWNNGGSIGGGYNGSSTVARSNKVSTCNFYTFAVNKNEAKAMNLKVQNEWKGSKKGGDAEVKALDVTIEDSFNFGLYVDTSAYDVQDIKYVVNGEEVGQKIALSTYKSGQIYAGSGNVFNFSYALSAKQIGDKVSVKGFNASGTETFETAAFSVKDYCALILDGGADEYGQEAVAVCKAILNYAAAAQTYFGYNTSSLANADLDDADKAYDPNVSFKTSEAIMAGSSTKVSFAGASISLESKIEINVYFELTSGTKLSDVTFEVDEVEVTPEAIQSKDGYFTYYKVTIKNIAPDDYDKDFTITADGISLQYSVFSYAKSIFDETSASFDGVKAVLKAVKNYYDAINDYIAD